MCNLGGLLAKSNGAITFDAVVITISRTGRDPVHRVVDKDEISIGRAPDSDIVLAHGGVSSRHARLFCRDGKVIIRDLGSTNGTMINGRRLERPRVVERVDTIRIGPYLLQISDDRTGPWL